MLEEGDPSSSHVMHPSSVTYGGFSLRVTDLGEEGHKYVDRTPLPKSSARRLTYSAKASMVSAGYLATM